ncbi:hypothetical protein ACIQH5_16560 [Paenarthrobacter sp. NPDC091711]
MLVILVQNAGIHGVGYAEPLLVQEEACASSFRIMELLFQHT